MSAHEFRNEGRTEITGDRESEATRTADAGAASADSTLSAAGAPDGKRAVVRQQGIRYLLVGGTSALLDLGGFQLLYTLIGWPLAVSSVTSIVVSTAYNFLMNRTATFQSTSNPVRSLVLYLFLLAVNTAFTTVCISLLVGVGVHSALAKVFTMLCTTTWNFVLYRKVVFV